MRRFGYFAGIVFLAGRLAAAASTPSEQKSQAALEPGIAARISSAKELVIKNPAQADNYTTVALAYVKAWRATDRGEYLKEAEQNAAQALRVAPDNFDAQKVEVAIRLAESRYREALELAKALNKKVPDDNQMYGFIADADIAVGDYAAAEKATQWMIDQRAVNAPALQRGAELRDIFGYSEPSLEWWNSALRITSSSDVEERAWILVHMSGVSLRMGKLEDAEKDARQALGLVENYPWAEDALAAALLSGEGVGDKANEAVSVLDRRLKSAPNVRAEFYLANALETAGKKAEAEEAWRHFEKDAEGVTSQPCNANRELVEYYALHGRAGDAVKLGAEEAARRQDIETLSAYALALVSAGKFDEARVQMDRALAPGIRDAKLFYRAGSIAAKLNDKATAAKYLKKAIEINASTPEAGQAIKLLANVM